MPWCEECSRFLTPTSTGPGGECPSCGRVVAAPGRADSAVDEPADEPNVPWHFKLLVLATVVYLFFRAVQGVLWLAGRF